MYSPLSFFNGSLSSHPTTACNYLPMSLSPDFSNILLKPSILPELNNNLSSLLSLQITNEIIEAEQRRLTELQQQLVSHLLQVSVAQKQQTTSLDRPVAPPIQKKTHARPHSCEQCGKRFRFHSNLVEHITVHRDGSDHYYPCPFCPKKCRLKGNLKKHLHRHFKTQYEVDAAWHQLYGGRSKNASESSSSSLSPLQK